MAIQKNFVVKNGIEVRENLIFADTNQNKVGIGTTVASEKLQVNGGIGATSLVLTGIGTIPTLQSTDGTITTLNNTTVIGSTLRYDSGYIVSGIVTSLSGSTLNYSGIATVGSLSIGSDEVISSAKQLKNIVSLDATTTATIEAAIANPPNVFTDLTVTGVSTFEGNVNFTQSASFKDNDTLDFGTGNDLRIYHDGTTNIITNQTNADLEINLGSNANSIFSVKKGTETLARFYRDALVDGKVELYYDDSKKFETIGAGVTVTGTTFTEQLSVSGVSTLGSVKISSGIVTATSGIVTYYGDGNYLDLSSNSSTGIGIGTTGGVIGYGITFLNLYGTGVSTTLYDSSVGIVTVFFEGGGGGAGGGESLDQTLAIGNTSSLGMSVGIVTASSFVKSGGTSSEFLKADGSVDSNTYLTTETQTLDDVLTLGNTSSLGMSVGIVTASSFVKSGGTSSEFLKADGSVDSNTYLTTETQTLDDVLTLGNVSLLGMSVGIVTATDFNSTSDKNLKENIVTVNNALDITNNLRGVRFEWKKDGKPSYGVIAQELEQILPELVSDTNPKTVNYNGIIGVLIEAVKELQLRVDELESKNK